MAQQAAILQAQRAAGMQALATQKIVALKIDPHARTHTWVTLAASASPPPEVAPNILLGVLHCAPSEMVHPALYYTVQCALGRPEPTDVAPYELKRSFCGARVVLWTRDDSPENLPAARFSFKGAPAGGRWLDTCFLVAYPKLPAEMPPAVAVPGTGFATRPGDAQLTTPLDTRAVLEAALEDGRLGVEWLTAAEASASPPSNFTLSMTSTAMEDENTVVCLKETRLKFVCAVCDAPCNSRCSRCAIVAYCSTACQKTAWKEHKKACKPKEAAGSQQAVRA
jgi:hypothetical protein